MTHFSHHAKTTAWNAVKRAAVAGALLVGAAAAFAQGSQTPVGVWQTIDDNTHQPKALVQISQGEDGTLSGKVIKGLNPADKPGKRCTACTDERKDQLILGMTIIKNMKQDGDKWDGGNILDPENGKVYKCNMHLEDGGQKLVVRGYIGFSLIGRSQTWIRQDSTAQAQN
ncbi:DUF2147 domain-containing protein [Trinickia sp. Y13]|jgi:uncharacterized protein (DUF2147 family)|uniref:DUF2147 domain-containing protein n=1 Tax=Trinickia sp. Y13 TaxID=2917807 RepID=UPI002404F699|nr:DUF2147 domain-containing protein [Trinickia sp. Y13]MDG0022838.1 DUF2147 domain-containing protein [Trinickia sp. Y13]